MCVNICTYMYIYVHIYMYLHMHTNVQYPCILYDSICSTCACWVMKLGSLHACVAAMTCTRWYAYPPSLIHIHTYSHSYIFTSIHTYTYQILIICKYMQTHSRVYMLLCTYIYRMPHSICGPFTAVSNRSRGPRVFWKMWHAHKGQVSHR